MSSSIPILFAFLFLTFINNAQPHSEAYMIRYSENDGAYTIDRIDLLSSYNKSGYNNQPFFDGGKLYLSSSRNGRDPVNTDLVQLDFQKKQLRYLTYTEEQEYSPAVFNDKLYFVKLDHKTKDQELWSLDRGDVARELPFTNVAYYRIIDRDRVALVLLENNRLNLYLYNRAQQSKKLISHDVGRSLELLDSEHLIFVHKYSREYWHLKKYSLASGRVSIVQKTIQNAEDFHIDDHHRIWMGGGSKIYTLDPGSASPEWQSILDLEKYELTNIKRLTTNNNNQIVVINQ